MAQGHLRVRGALNHQSAKISSVGAQIRSADPSLVARPRGETSHNLTSGGEHHLIGHCLLGGSFLIFEVFLKDKNHLASIVVGECDTVEGLDRLLSNRLDVDIFPINPRGVALRSPRGMAFHDVPEPDSVLWIMDKTFHLFLSLVAAEVAVLNKHPGTFYLEIQERIRILLADHQAKALFELG